MRVRTISLIISVALFAVACGGGVSLNEDEAAIAENVELRLGVERFDDEQNQCIGESIVSEVGVDRLAELGVTADEFPDSATLSVPVQESYYAGIVDCLDIRQFLRDSDASGSIRDCWLDAMSEQSLAVMVLIASSEDFLGFNSDQMADLTDESDAAEEQC